MIKLRSITINDCEVKAWAWFKHGQIQPIEPIVDAVDVLVASGLTKEYAVSLCTPVNSDHSFHYDGCGWIVYWSNISSFFSSLYDICLISHENVSSFKTGFMRSRARY